VAQQRHLDNLCVVLVSTRNPLNIGAAARAMSNFGVSRLRVVNPYELAFREARSAVGALPILTNAEKYSSVVDAIADCTLVIGTTAAQNRELQHPLYVLADAAPMVRDRARIDRVAILFGSEKRGLSNHDLSHCHWLLRIPTLEEHFSMNLGQAVAVCLYELARVGSATLPEAEPLANAKQLELLTATLLESLQISGYLKEPIAAATEDKIRRLVHHLHLTNPDAETLVGMLRQVIWKMNYGNDSNH
jgi:tRNA/rRNA methyltransferase